MSISFGYGYVDKKTPNSAEFGFFLRLILHLVGKGLSFIRKDV